MRLALDRSWATLRITRFLSRRPEFWKTKRYNEYVDWRVLSRIHVRSLRPICWGKVYADCEICFAACSYTSGCCRHAVPYSCGFVKGPDIQIVQKMPALNWSHHLYRQTNVASTRDPQYDQTRIQIHIDAVHGQWQVFRFQELQVIDRFFDDLFTR